MRIGVDARLMYHQPAGISKYTLNLLQAFAELRSMPNNGVRGRGMRDQLASKPSPTIDDLDFVIFQHRKHLSPIIRKLGFRRSTLYSPTHTRLEQFTLPIELLPYSLDLFHSPDFIPPLNSPVPTVITVHDLAFLHWPHFITEDSATFYGQIDRAVTRTKHIIVPSESTKKDLVAQLGVPAAMVTVIYEAANPRYRPLPIEPTQAEVVRKYKIPEKYIFFVGTIEPRKNVDGLLRAFRYLQDKYKLNDVGLVIAGGYGWLYDEIMQTVEELGLGKRAFFLGRVPDEDLWKLYVAARCHVHAAHYEGFGLPPLEAMACGTPTIVSNISSLPEVVGDAALLVDPTDTEEIAVAMHRLLTDETLHAEMRTKGIQRAKCYSWLEAALQTAAVYRHVLDPEADPMDVIDEADRSLEMRGTNNALNSKDNRRIGETTLPEGGPEQETPEQTTLCC